MLLISPNFDVKLIIFFPNFGQGPFPKIAGKTLQTAKNGPHCNKTCLRGFGQSEFQTKLFSSFVAC